MVKITQTKAHPDLKEAIRSSYLAQGLSEAQLECLDGLASLRLFSTGEKIVEEFDRTRDLMILSEGLAQILNVVGEPIGVIKAGMPIGEVSFIDGKPRSGTVVALQSCVVVVLPWEPLMDLMKSSPEIASRCLWNVCQILCARLRITNQHLAALMALEESTYGAS